MFYDKLEDTGYPWMKWFKMLDNWSGDNFKRLWFIMVPFVIPYIFVITPMFFILNRFDWLIDRFIGVTIDIIDYETRRPLIIGLQMAYILLIAIPPMIVLSLTYLAPHMIGMFIEYRKDKKARRETVNQRVEDLNNQPTVFGGVNDTIRQRRLQPKHTYQHDVVNCNTIVSGRVKKHNLMG